MPEMLRIKPLVPGTLWWFWQRLHEALPDVRPVWHTRLSTFIDPVKAGQQYEASHGPDIRGFVLNTSVDLVLSVQKKISDRHADYFPFAVFDIDFDSKKLELFRELGIYYEKVPRTQELLSNSDVESAVMLALRRCIENPHRVTALKPLLEGGQSWAIDVATRLVSCGQVFSEVGLSSFIDVGSLSGLSREDRNFLLRTTVDALICTPPPMAIPLFVIEWDGEGHNKEKQKKKDGTKDDALSRAGLSGVRIKTRDLPPASWRHRKDGNQKVVNSILEAFVDQASRRQDNSWWLVEQLQAALLWKVADVSDESLRNDISVLLKALAPRTRQWARRNAAANIQARRSMRSPPESESEPADWINEEQEFILDQWREENEAIELADAIDKKAIDLKDVDSRLTRYFLGEDGWKRAGAAKKYWRILKPGSFLRQGYTEEVRSESPEISGIPIGGWTRVTRIFFKAIVDAVIEIESRKLRMNRHNIAAGLRRAVHVQRERQSENERDQRRKKYAALTEEQCLEKFIAQLNLSVIQQRVLRREFPLDVLKDSIRGRSLEEKAGVSVGVRHEAEVELKRILQEVHNDLPVNFDAETIKQMILEEFDRSYGTGAESQESS